MTKRFSRQSDSNKQSEYIFEQFLWSEISRNIGWIIGGALSLSALTIAVLYLLLS